MVNATVELAVAVEGETLVTVGGAWMYITTPVVDELATPPSVLVTVK
jgi:hypothetical protein